MNYAVKQRMHFIETMLKNYGTINRIVLCDFFGISIPQTTKDFRMYIKLAPNNMRYITTTKKYIVNPEFVSIFDKGNND